MFWYIHSQYIHSFATYNSVNERQKVTRILMLCRILYVQEAKIFSEE